jgi:hypothetical protein
MGSDTESREVREEMSVIIAQTSSVCEGGRQTIFAEALTFRNSPKCHIGVLEREKQRCISEVPLGIVHLHLDVVAVLWPFLPRPQIYVPTYIPP